MSGAITHIHLSLFPDEHALGILGRLQLYSAYRSLKVTAGDVSDDLNGLNPAVVWRKLYADIHRQWCPEVSLDNFAQRHTLSAYYQPFLPDAKRPLTSLDKLNVPQGNVIHHTLLWRYCALCAEEDCEQYGVPYFHVSHQLPGLSVCQRHNTPLLSGCLSCGLNWARLGKLLAPPLTPICSQCGNALHSLTPQPYLGDDIRWLQEMALALRYGKYSSLSLERLQRGYQHWLGMGPRSGVLSMKERAQVKEAQNVIDNYFDPRLYRALFTNADMPNVANRRTTAISLYQAAFSNTFISPVVHLLLIRAMYGDINHLPT